MDNGISVPVSHEEAGRLHIFVGDKWTCQAAQHALLFCASDMCPETSGWKLHLQYLNMSRLILMWDRHQGEKNSYCCSFDVTVLNYGERFCSWFAAALHLQRLNDLIRVSPRDRRWIEGERKSLSRQLRAVNAVLPSHTLLLWLGSVTGGWRSLQPRVMTERRCHPHRFVSCLQAGQFPG